MIHPKTRTLSPTASGALFIFPLNFDYFDFILFLERSLDLSRRLLYYSEVGDRTDTFVLTRSTIRVPRFVFHHHPSSPLGFCNEIHTHCGTGRARGRQLLLSCRGATLTTTTTTTHKEVGSGKLYREIERRRRRWWRRQHDLWHHRKRAGRVEQLHTANPPPPNNITQRVHQVHSAWLGMGFSGLGWPVRPTDERIFLFLFFLFLFFLLFGACWDFTNTTGGLSDAFYMYNMDVRFNIPEIEVIDKEYQLST